MWARLRVLCFLFLAGCAGFIDEGMPELRTKFPRSKKVCLAMPLNRSGNLMHERGPEMVREAFVKAFDKRAIPHSLATNGCDIVISVAITGWEYGDAGFSGRGDRDSVSLKVVVQDTKTKFVKARADLYARRLDDLVDKYVGKLFVEPEE